MRSLMGPLGGRKLLQGLAAAAVLGSLAVAAPAAASQAFPNGYLQSYTIRPAAFVHSIIIYQGTANGGGTTNSFEALPPFTTITDPFPKYDVITSAYFIGVTEFGSEDPEATKHLVLAGNNDFIRGILKGGQDFADIFPDFSETSLIDAMELLSSPDLDKLDPGYADQMAAKDAAFDLVFKFSDTMVADGGTFAGNSSFRMAAFSVPTEYGDGDAAQTAVAVPEPAAWALMILGFGAVGAGLRRRRARDGFAAA